MTAKPTRSEFVRQRRTSRPRSPQASRSRSRPVSRPRSSRTSQPAAQKKRVYRPETVFLPVTPRSLPRRKQFTSRTHARRQDYDIAFNLGRTGVRAPTISLPQFGPRWISALLTLLLGFLLYTMWTASTFIVTSAEVSGSQRLGVPEINAMLGVSGQSIFKIVPALIETNLRTAYPDLSSVRVQVGFPNRVTVDVVERMPLLAWYQNGMVAWIDTTGVAFLPRGEVPGLVQVAANGAPPQIQPDPAAPLYEQKFIASGMVQAMIALFPYMPAGIPMIYDPEYGMGWQDPHGWFVYFGQNTEDIPMKLVVYQAIVDTFSSQGIQPALVSVEYLDAPFYK